MKKGIIAIILFMFAVPAVFGTIITNTNQSVMYIRLPARNASMLIDAVYYNPAGVVHLDDGFHLAFHSQSIWQDKTVTNSFPYLNDSTYVGEVRVPIFPTFFAVYKKGKLALSFGFGPNSGGGTADFKTGLPDFEIPVSLLPGLVSTPPPVGLGIPTNAYSVEMAFKGKSIYYGFQGNISYAINDVFSVAAGARYIYAVTEYDGELKNIQINPQHPLINPSGGLMSAVQFFNMAYPPLAPMVADIAADVKQTGSAITPLFGLNIRPNENLNIGIRYEFNTKLEMTNDTTVDGTGLFPDGYEFRNDIPAILSLGLEYAIAPNLRIMVSYNQFFDKNAVWGEDPTVDQDDLIDSNSYDIGIGFEYDITDSILISAGYLRTQVGVTDEYQDSFSHELNSDTFGFGSRIMLTPKISLDLAGLYTAYTEAEKPSQRPDFPLPFTETYQRWNWAFSVGLGFHL
jgi:long-chain fatty acid transport protein